MAGADAGAPGDPGDQAVLLDLAVVVVAVAAVIGRDDEQRVAIEAGGGHGVEQRRQALVGLADGFELRVRHPAVRVAEIVGIGEVNELDLGLLLDEVARRLVDHLLAEVAGARDDGDRAGVGDVLELSLADERGRTPPLFSAASKTVGTWM